MVRRILLWGGLGVLFSILFITVALYDVPRELTEQDLRRRSLLEGRPAKGKIMSVNIEYGSIGSKGYACGGYVLVISVAKKYAKWVCDKLDKNLAVNYIDLFPTVFSHEVKYKVMISTRAGTKDIEAVFALEEEAQKLFGGD